jgi:carboxypeptidase Taq
MNAYAELVRRHQRIHRLGHLQAIAQWDQSANMPSKGTQARALAIAEMDGLLHELATAPELATLLKDAQAEALSEFEQASLREMTRSWRADNALPPQLVESLSLAASNCEHAWRSQRHANDWAGHLPLLEKVVELSRQTADFLSEASGLSKYDAMLDQHEPGMRADELQRVFSDLKSWLPGLIQDVQAKQAQSQVVQPQGPFSKTAQRELGQAVMALMGFDFEAGRLDESAHPFCGGVPEDVRMTTRSPP